LQRGSICRIGVASRYGCRWASIDMNESFLVRLLGSNAPYQMAIALAIMGEKLEES